MKHLNKITISNIRRFKENVEIEIGKGATVFLAPNGTGKTAIFEAIELALTGAVRRLDYPPNAIIRDTCSNSFIRLDFEGDKFCEAKFSLGSPPITNGNHKDLFGNIDAQDIPFLIRLTHLLCQRGDDWFVQSNGTAAGNQLDHLSIGKDAAKANSVITSAKKAANVIYENALKELENAKNNQQDWDKLIERRKQLSGNNSSLIPQQEILDKINAIAKAVGNIKIEPNCNIIAIENQHSVVSTTLEQLIADIRKRAISLQSLNDIVPNYSNGKLNLASAEQSLRESRDSKSKSEGQIVTLHESISKKVEEIASSEKVLSGYRETKRQIDQLDKINQDKITFDAKATDLKTGIEKLNSELQSAELKFSSSKKIKEQHQVFRLRAATLNEQVVSNEELRTLLKTWQEVNQELKSLETDKRPKALQSVEEAKRKIELLNTEHASLINAQKDAQNSFDLLNKTSDSIREAVGIIATQLSKESDTCPVCYERYEPSELQKRIAKALSLIGSELQPAAQRLDQAKDVVSKSQGNINISINELSTANQSLKDIDDAVSQLKSRISQSILPKFPAISLAEDAAIYINKLGDQVTQSINQLNKEKESAEQEPSDEEVAILSNNLEKLRSNLSSLSNELAATELLIKKCLESKNSLQKIIGDIPSTDALTDNILKLEKKISETRLEVEAIRKLVTDEQTLLGTLNERTVQNERYVSSIGSNLNEHIAQWKDLELTGEPSIDLLEKAKGENGTLLSNRENDKQKIDSLNIEITKWRKSEEYLKIESDIKRVIGRSTEAEYAKKIKEDFDKANNAVQTINLKIKTLNSFAKNIDSELKKVNDRIQSINPLWNKLLKRIVVDPRFANTNLNSYSHYKKQHADVNIKLHGDNTLVAHVASEAQITDLQFTFLLAMAQKYQWSPWRTLLLDDPTQHHDLVHASAVFDLLRDYITTFDFQVLLATHDTVQAKFFMRKLENDGIPAKLWVLQGTEDGVTAIAN
ncbi:MAG: hypothetical protein K0Q79_694 [Flavipsychrobacter sp.]|jgi:exonuclease SbcC|nr:hypothetical protein [Flavipsychrobacter sp.]